MKKIILFLALFTGALQLDAQVNFEALKLTPAYPKQNSKLSFEYNKDYSPLIKQAGVDVVVYQFNNKGGIKVSEPVPAKKGNLYTATVMIDSNTNCIAFGFTYGEEKDYNGSKGYIVPVYNQKNAPVKEYYSTASGIQMAIGEYMFGLPLDAEKGIAYLEEGMNKYPELKTDPRFLNTYLQSINKAKKKDAPVLTLAKLQDFEAKGNLSEAGYATLIQWYAKDKRKGKVDSLTTAMKAAFPQGDWMKNEAVMVFFKENDPAKKLALYQQYITRYPPTEADKTVINNYKSQLASAYGQAKDYKSFNEWNNQIPKGTAALNNNNLAWEMAERDENIQEARKMAESAASYAKTEVEKPTEKKPDNFTNKQWLERRKDTYATFGDTYAYILYKTGDYKTAYPVSKDAATINKLKDAELNERYAMLAEKVLAADEAKKLIEGFVKEGVASAKTKDALKEIYVKEKKSADGFDDYVAALEAAEKNKKREEIAKSIMSDPSPSFSLKDFEGKPVNLDDLKGKVVVVDFWATWCGPCIASMPAMNKTLEKFKGNENVKFVFVDTWEKVDDKLKNAKDFMAKKNYPFYVLMDTDDKMVKDFNVSGIPTKFVIDKEGKIRFKSVGFENDDSLVDELTTMIELAGK